LERKSWGNLKSSAKTIPRNKEIAELPIHRLKANKDKATKLSIQLDA
jgi:hypothetical protein